jgi:hypothetical protein
MIMVDLFPNEQNFDLDKSRQKFHHSLKSITKLVILRSFVVAKCCKMRIIYYSSAKFAVFQSFCITHGKLIPLSEKRYQFPARNTQWLKNGKLRRAILSAFYNISQRNFGILLILWCSFKLWWNFCPDLFWSKFCSLGNRSITMHNESCSGAPEPRGQWPPLP